MDMNGSDHSPTPFNVDIMNRHSEVSSIGSSDTEVYRAELYLQSDNDEDLSDGPPTSPRNGVIEDTNITKPRRARPSNGESNFVTNIASSLESDSSKRSWKPFWLSTIVLVVFTNVFTIIAVVTALLYHFSEKYRGIATQRQDNYYMWKYGPTAVLIVINAFWRQVDFMNKISMPWKELRTEPNSFMNALTLDYISPTMPVGLCMALKNKHWSVVLSSLGHVLILATTISSTSLLSLESTEMTREWTGFHQTSEFRLLEGWDKGWMPVGPQAAYIYHGIHEMGLKYPSGTSEDVIIPDIEVNNVSSDVLGYTTYTEGLKIKFECQVPSVTNVTRANPRPWIGPNIWDLVFTAAVETPGCLVTGVPVTSRRGLRVLELEDPTIAKATHAYAEIFSWYTCENGTGFRYGDTNYAPTNESATNLRLLAAVTDLTFTPFDRELGRYGNAHINNLSVTVCKPSYFIDLFEVGKPNPGNGSAQAKLSANSKMRRKQLDGLSDGGLGGAVFNVVAESSLVTDWFEKSFFTLLRSKNHQSLTSAFLDPDLLTKTSSEVLQGVAAQLLRPVAVQPSTKNLTGQITWREERLKVTTYSMGFICGFCGLLAILSLALILIRPGLTIPVAPDSIASVAYILASDRVLKRTLIYQQPSSLPAGGRWRGSSLIVKSGFLKKSSGASSSSPGTRECKLACPSTQNGDYENTSWWHPMAGSNWFFALATGLPLAVIASLEILQHFSQMNKGLIDLQPISTPILSTYIPVVIALSISALYSSIEFMVVLFTPFVALKQSNVTTSRALSFSPFGKLLPQTLYLSFKSKHYAIVLTTLASLVGSFLTIVTSGLYTTIDSPGYLPIPFAQADTFNLTMSTDINSQVSEVVSLIEFRGMRFPKWTYEELVFNGWNKPTLPIDVEGQAKRLTAVVPAVRPRLNCTEVTNTKRLRDQELFTTLVLRDWCDALPTGNMSQTVTYQQSYPTLKEPGKYFGMVDFLDYVFDTVFGGNKNHGCPTISATLGLVRAVNNTSRENGPEYDTEIDVAMLMCYQILEQVDTEVNLKLPDLYWDEKRPPLPDESSVKLLVNQNGSSKFSYDMYNVMNSLLGSAPKELQDMLNNETAPDIDPSLITMIHGQNGRPIEELAGRKNVKNLAKAVDGYYGRYMAQILSFDMRIKHDNDMPSSAVYNGFVELDRTKRLYQNKTSKLIIQIMLAIMVACAVTAKFLLPTRGVLLHNPCSIYGITSILIDGSLVSKEMVSSAKSWKGNSNDLLERVYGEKLYTLKWWTSRDGKQWYGIDVGEKCTDKPCKTDQAAA